MRFSRLTAIVVFASLLVCFAFTVVECVAAGESDTIRVYLGTYTRGDSEGVYVCDLDRTAGVLKNLRLAGKAENPAFLTFHPTQPLCYAIGEMGRYNDRPGGAVFAFKVDDETGSLEMINAESSLAGAPCHVTTDAEGRFVFAANYSGGNVISLPIRKDGGVAPVVSLIQHEGAGPNKQRQEKAHAHSVDMDPKGRLLVCDLGVDRVFIYNVDPDTGELAQHAALTLAPGSGPRHLALHPENGCLYVLNELASTISVFTYDEEQGDGEIQQTITTLPEGFAEQNTTAEIIIDPSGRFVYASNRGHNSIAVFAIDPETGKLTFVERESSGGEWPRCFGIDPSGRFLVSANQYTDNVALYRIDQETGELSPTGSTVLVGQAVCVKFRECE